MRRNRRPSSRNDPPYAAKLVLRASARIARLALFVAAASCGGDGNEAPTPTPTPASLPAPVNDPLFGRQWHLENTGQESGARGADVKATLVAEMRLQPSGEVGPRELILRSREGGLATLRARAL